MTREKQNQIIANLAERDRLAQLSARPRSETMLPWSEYQAAFDLWARIDLRATNGEIQELLREALRAAYEAGRREAA